MRQVQMIIVIGTNRTGKTTLVKDIVQKISRRCLVITPAPYEKKWADFPTIKRNELNSFPGFAKIIYKKNDFIGLHKKLFDAVLVLDDFGAYETLTNKEKTALKSLLVRRVQRKLDIFFIAHGFTDIVPTFIFRYNTSFSKPKIQSIWLKIVLSIMKKWKKLLIAFHKTLTQIITKLLTSKL